MKCKEHYQFYGEISLKGLVSINIKGKNFLKC